MCIFRQLSDEHQQTIREVFHVYSHQTVSWVAVLNLLEAITVLCNGLLEPATDRVRVAVHCGRGGSGGQDCRIGIFPRRGDRPFVDSLTLQAIRSYLETIDVQPDE